jgi:FkbM family methyltransferase
LAELFERVAPECVIDVGANAGQYGEMLRDHGYEGWIVSFEPVPSAYSELAARAERDGRWRAFRLALGSRAERRQIAVAGVSQLSSFRPFNRHGLEELPGASEVVQAEEVEVRTLNDLWAQALDGLAQTRVFLKLDTQGWDLEVLEGAHNVLSPLVGLQLEAALMPIYEESPSFTHSVQAVLDLGFDLTGIFPVNRDSLFRLLEVDCVFINPRHVEAEAWHEDTWSILSARFEDEVTQTIPPGRSFVLIDDATLGLDEVDGRRAVPFLERDGEYAGRPDGGERAVAELGRQVARGAGYVVVAWPSFWWLEEYTELAEHLGQNWHRVRDTDAAIVFARG